MNLKNAFFYRKGAEFPPRAAKKIKDFPLFFA